MVGRHAARVDLAGRWHLHDAREDGDHGLSEDCVQFGASGHLAGVVTEPAAAQVRRGAVVLVSAGLIAKEGPFRLYTELARRLAKVGFLTLRFDLGGIGDSLRSHGPEQLRKRTELEIRSAIDHLTERYTPASIVLGGLCSGAEDSFRSAEVDSRVNGVVMIDPFAYRTRGWRWRHFLSRVQRRCAHALGLYAPTARRTPSSAKPLVSYAYMRRAESTRIMKALVRRGVRVHFVYTGGASDAFNHNGQLKAMFSGVDLGRHVTVDHFPEMDHMQVLSEHRRELVDRIAARLTAPRRRRLIALGG